MPVLKASIVVFVTVGMAALLAYLARRTTRSWPVTGSLLLGSVDADGAQVDLRFAAVVAALVTALVTMLSFQGVFATLSPTEMAFFLVLTLPVVACVLSVVADLALRIVPASWRPEPESDDTTNELLDAARAEVCMALAQVEDPSRIAALEALTEAVSEYDSALGRNGETARHLRKTIRERVIGVITLARSCQDGERREASQVLGVRLEAAPSEVEAVYSALSAIYEGPDGMPGVDPTRQLELRAAYDRLRVRPKSQAA